MIGARILAGYDDELGVVDIVQGDAGLADSDGFLQCNRGRLVTHVGTIRQIVGPERTSEKLVDERGLVRRPPGGVENCLVRTVEGPKLITDQGERILPCDGFVEAAAGAFDHRMRDASLLAEPVFGPRVEIVDAVSREELRRGPRGGCFLGDCLGAVLAELGGVAVARVRVGPRAAHAVETLGLIEIEECPRGAHRAHVAQCSLE